MSYLALARKWRPKNFTELVGQEHVVKALRNALDSGRVHHAFLFTGTRGVGKTTIARIFAKSLNCERGVSSDPCGECQVCRDVDAGRFVDLIEIDAASRTKVDDTRELLEDVIYAPSRGRYKVFLIDEVHMLSGHSFNALLKTLEEPPEHVKFLLATTDPQKLPVTVLSRCLQFNLRRLRSDEIAAQMSHILAAEAITAEAGALPLLAQAADGSLRDGLSLLDQAIAHGGGRLDESDVRSMLGTIDQDAVLNLLGALSAGDGPGLYAAVEALAAFVVDYGGVLDAVAAALHRIQLRQLVPAAGTNDETLDPARIDALAERIAPEDVQLYYQIASQGARDIGLAPTPRIGLEMALLRMLAFRPVPDDAATGGTGRTGGAQPRGRSEHEPKATRAPVDRSSVRAAADTPTVPAGTSESSVSSGAASHDKSKAPTAAQSALERTASLPNMAVPHDTTTWMAALDRMGIRAAARQLADNCTVLGEQDGTLRLGLRREHELLLSDMLRRQIEQALIAAVGTQIRVRIEIIAGDAADMAQATTDTPAHRAQVAKKRQQAHAELAFRSDPGVQSALDAFDAELVPDSIRPAR